MSRINELMKKLISLDIKLRVENGKLKYNAPPGVVNNNILDEIKEYRDELIEFISRKQYEKIKPASANGNIPLSFAQQRLWFLDKLEEDSFAYNLPFPVKIKGSLNVEALKNSLLSVLERHSVLRTTFPEKDGAPHQKINTADNYKIPLITVPGNSEQEKMDYVKTEISEMIKKPYDLSAGPLYYMSLYKIDESLHILFMMFHHIVLDGWSIEILMREISESYNSAAAGRLISLPPLEIQYSDFSIWHNEWMKSSEAEKQLDYWKRELEDAPALLQMPLVNPRPAEQTLNGTTVLFEIDADRLEGLKSLAKMNNSSLFMVLFAGFSALLYRYSGQKDISIGTTIANRNRKEIEPLIGMFANTLVLRTDISGSPSFNELLSRVREKLLNAYDNQDIPFEKIVEEVRPERSLSHTPLFQILFELQEKGYQPGKTGKLEMTPLEMENKSAKFDMNMILLANNGRLSGSLEYNTDLFDSGYINNLIEHYGNILKSVVENPGLSIDSIDYLSEDEKKQIEKWNSTEENFPTDSTFDELFTKIVDKYPERIAAVENGKEITYKELNKKALELSHIITETEAQNTTVTAILLDRGIEYLTSVLAVFKSGGAFLPLDPKHPAARHTQIIEQSRPGIIITSEKYDAVINEAAGNIKDIKIKKLIIDNLPQREACVEKMIKINARPDDLAYIIFTSGSTGKPKGAMVLQKGMINHLYSKIRDLGITASDYIAQNASQCFDISVWQYLAALLTGGKIEIFQDEVAHDTELLLEKVEKHGLTILEVVPSFMSVMIDMIENRTGYKFEKLRWLVPTGEALPKALAVKWLNYFPCVPLINAYGPTECSDDVTHYPIKNVSDLRRDSVPIGKPIGNTKILILDKNMRLTPVWIPGELYVAGICVGKGYINDKERSDAAFIENPFSPGEMLYKSGDLARYLPDGNIEFLGRVDSQVKVRGFRIELGEIETELRKCESLKEAAVMVSKSGKELIAYIVPEEESVFIEEKIKTYLKERLPEYMAPSYYVILNKLPLTANGKLDRKVLPEPVISTDSGSIRLPETNTEIEVSAIWKEILKHDVIGAEQNFFEIGGHSLLATRLVSRIRDKYKIEIGLKIVFEKPTIKNLSAYIDALIWLSRGQNGNADAEMENITL